MENNKKILVVDDDDYIRNIIHMILENEGYEITELADGHHIAVAVSDFHLDVILLDVMLGDMDGRDICRELKEAEATKGIAITMVSASHRREVMQFGGCLVNDYLSKPFDMSELLQKVGYFAAA